MEAPKLAAVNVWVENSKAGAQWYFSSEICLQMTLGLYIGASYFADVGA